MRVSMTEPCPQPSPSMKVPPKRKGNDGDRGSHVTLRPPSMKVPPKRKGNPYRSGRGVGRGSTLNESPSEKEGK